jgi:hypothetical protein
VIFCQRKFLLAGVVIFFDRGTAAQFYSAIFISIIFLLLDTALRPFYDFRCNALKTLVSTSMVITLLCGLCSKLDPEGTVIGENTLGWTLVIVNVVIVLLVLCLEFIRRALSVVRGVRSGISYLKSTEAVSSSGVKLYEGEFRLSAEDAVRSVVITQYPIHAYPDVRSVHSKLVTLGETEHLCQVHALEVERGLLYVATPLLTTTLEKHTTKFQTCPMAVQDFASAMIEGLDQLHRMGIAHGNIRPHTILLDDSKLVISDFSGARLVEADAAAFKIDIEMAASTILFALSGGQMEEETTFSDLLEAAKSGFPASPESDSLFDGIRAGRAEAVDLLRTMVGSQVPLRDCLARPFFWTRDKTAAYLGEEIGNLLDPGATKASAHYAFIEALEARGAVELGGAYNELLKQDGPSWAALLDPDYPLVEAKSEADPTGWGTSRSAQQPPTDVEHCYAVYGKNPSAKQKTAREGHLKSGKKMPMANRRMVGLLKTIRNVAFAHRSQHVQAGRFDTEEDVLRYMLDPFPWLLMAVYELDQEHKIAGSVAEAAAKTTGSALTTDGESTSQDEPGKKSGKIATASGGVAVPPKKGKQGKQAKANHGPKAPNQATQKDKTIQMQKETIAQKDAEIAKQAAELAQLRGEFKPTDHRNQEPALARKKAPKSPARQRPTIPAREATEAGSRMKRPPSLHTMAQRANTLSPGRTRSFGSPGHTKPAQQSESFSTPCGATSG